MKNCFSASDFRHTETEIGASLAEMEALFNPEDQMKLYVSLYDPKTGGMYFSQPSVGRKGFGPNILHGMGEKRLRLRRRRTA